MSTWPKNSIASKLRFDTLLLIASLVAVDASKASERTTNMKIRMSIADKVVIATVADNATARDFVSVLPLSVPMKDLFGREKYGDLPKALSENGPKKNTVRSRRHRLLVSRPPVRCLLPPRRGVHTFARRDTHCQN